MTDESNREKQIFEEAFDLESAEERQRFLVTACGDDAALLARVQVLLQAGEAAEAFLPEHPHSQPPERLLTEKPGDRIGRYKLLQQIGEGGCGVVYMAEQEEPVRRRVALKVIKLGMDTKQVIARFEAERQALALMDHPHIAKVLDAGATETGRPYFVMELVRGVKITEFCDENNVTTVDRLKLFIQVCQAIQHAHQKGVIHRDIKPSNILVTVNDGVPVPKVIDFGIAKATQGRLTDHTLFTAFEQFIGTPAYMSPEQAVLTSLDIDTRSDIYSLGVLLYELLVGCTPFDQKELLAAGLDEMRRTIREKEPPKPSTRLTQELVAADVRRLNSNVEVREPKSEEKIRASSRRLLQEVRGDLDWIVMKCLEKERGRRYETANGVAADIQRHLNNEPVIARPPSKLYELQKTLRRHKFGFGATAAIIIVLAVGITLTAWQAKRAVAALDELRATAPAFAAEARSLAAKERFDEAIPKLDYAIKLRPDVPEYRMAKTDLLREQALTTWLRTRGIKFNLSLLPDSKHRLMVVDEPLSDLSFLKDAPIGELVIPGTSVSDLRPLEQLALTRLDVRRTPVNDLSPLRGPVLSASLRHLELWLIPATDFSPIAACTNLEWLDAAATALTDLEVVRGRKLRGAQLSYSKITDISVLAGMPLERVTLCDTAVTDLRPLLECPTLKELVIPSGAHDVNALRSLPGLTKLSYEEITGFSKQTAEDFWLGYERDGYKETKTRLEIGPPTKP